MSKQRSLYKCRDIEVLVDIQYEELITLSIGNGYRQITLPFRKIFEVIDGYEAAQQFFRTMDELRLTLKVDKP